MLFPKTDTVLLDFDGTLATCPYDFPRMHRAVEEVAAQFGLTRLEGGILEKISAGAEALRNSASEAVAEEFRRQAEAALQAIELEAAAVSEMLPGVVEAVGRLRQAGLRVGIITRNCRAAVKLILGQRELPADLLLTREEVSNAKPHPEHLLAALGRLGSQPSRAVMVGDHPMDIQAGRQLGLRTVGVLTGNSTRQELERAGADLVLESVADLPEALGTRS